MWRRATCGLGVLGLMLGLSMTQNPLKAQLFRQSHHEPPPPPTLTEVARMIDHIESAILHQGTVVIKQPDIWSQARMTKFRKEFEDTMALELNKFEVRLAARIARSDAAQFSSQTALAASMTPLARGQRYELEDFAAVTAERDDAINLLSQDSNLRLPAFNSTPIAGFGLMNAMTPVGNIVTDPSGTDRLGQTALPFGLEPTVQLDQQANYITHLHRLRRINLGDDNADSAGYGLYLMRVPVSIQPGDRTVKGHGAIVTLTMQHDFGPHFLASTYRNLVINDVIDKLGGPIHELIRSGTAMNFRVSVAQIRDRIETINKRLTSLRDQIRDPVLLGALPRPLQLPDQRLDPDTVRGYLPKILEFQSDLSGFERRAGERIAELTRRRQELEERAESTVLTLEETLSSAREEARLTAGTFDVAGRLSVNPATQAFADIASQGILGLEAVMPVDGGAVPGVWATRSYGEVADVISQFAEDLTLEESLPGASPNTFQRTREAVRNIETELRQLDNTIQETSSQIETLGDEIVNSESLIDEARQISERIREAVTQTDQLVELARAVGTTLPVSRTGSRINAVAPSDLNRIFISENLLDLAYDAQVALDLLGGTPKFPETERNHWKVRLTEVRSYLRHELEAAYDLMAGSDRSQPALLMDISLIESITDSVTGRTYEGSRGVDPNSPQEKNALREVYSAFIGRLPGNLSRRPVGVLSWAIAVEAGLLNRHLQQDMQQVIAEDYACPPDVETLFFYTPIPTPEAEFAFQEYVKARWPMITFALEPVTDQQNIEDAFTRRRDLQLAVAFALASGRISFRQALQFTRQLQYEAQTIALNQTVTAFAHANDTFGWRFTPRYQTPPEESNPLAVANLLSRGGPGPNYQLKNSKLEPGMRELTAVVVMPSFVRGLRIDTSSDWYPLHDPDERKIKTAKSLIHGHRINEAREALAMAEVCGYYRPEDVERLRVRLLQLERLLPMQTSRVQVPYENTLGGFALFTQGVTALVPQLTGFEGVEYLDASKGADILVHGKNFSIYEMEVVAGGRMLLREGTGTAVLEREKRTQVLGTTISPLRTSDDQLVVFAADGRKETIKDVGTYNIVSREVLRVRIPEKVETSTRSDGQEFVELFVSTPNGISNRLQIPTGPPPRRQEAAAPTPVPTFSPSPTGSDYAFLDSELIIRLDAFADGNEITAIGVNSVSPDSLRLQPIDRDQPLDKPVEVTLWFPAPGLTNAVSPPLKLRLEKGTGDFYTFTPDDLRKIAEHLRELMRNTNNAIPPDVTSKSVTVTPVPPPAIRPSSTTNPLRVTFEYVLRPKPTTPTTMSPPPPQAGQAHLADRAGDARANVVPAVEFASSGQAVSGDRAELLRDGAVSPASSTTAAPVAVQARFRQDTEVGVGAGEIPPPAAPIQVQVSLPPLPDGVVPGTPAAQPSQTLVVLPQRSPSVNVSVPITNQQPQKRSRLFHREPATPANPTRPPLRERLRGGF